MNHFTPAVGLALFACCGGVFINAASVTLTIRDASNAEPMPARVHLRDATGKAQRAGALPFWHDHFVCPGKVDLELPIGAYTYEVGRGPEYATGKGSFTVEVGNPLDLSVRLARIADLAAEGWWSGETHVHRKTADAELLMRAEDLHAGQFITWWNRSNPWTDAPPPKALPFNFDKSRAYHPLGGEDERDGGALLFLDLQQPIEITAGTKHFPSSAVYAKQARERGARWIDAEKPFWWDFPMWVARGVVDTVGIAQNHMHQGGVLDNEAWGRPRDREKYAGPHGNGLWTQDIYYHLLNCGVRLPPSAGSASGVLPNPVGYNRAYVHLGGGFSYAKWREGLLAGRSFVGNGPLLRVRANGELSGHIFKPKESLTVEIDGQLDSRDPIARVELVRDGRVELIQLPVRFTAAHSGWFLVRAIASVTNTFRFASTAPWHVEIGGQPMKPRRESAQFFVDWCRERMGILTNVRELTLEQKEAVLAPWREAESFWISKLQ